MIALVVHQDLTSIVFVNRRWDPEHKLDFTYEGGAITEVNGDAFRLQDGVVITA
jgi:hypothetical protein